MDWVDAMEFGLTKKEKEEKGGRRRKKEEERKRKEGEGSEETDNDITKGGESDTL